MKKNDRASCGKTVRKESSSRAVFLRLVHNPSAMSGFAVFIILVVLAILAPYITPYQYDKLDVSSIFQLPSAQHWFGTDKFGRDVLTRILYGGRYSLSISFISVVFAALAGIALGALCGYFGGTFDDVVMRFLDIFQAIPGILLTICISAALGSGFDKTIFALSITRVPGITRLMRGSVMKVKDMEYLEAAESIGCSKMRMIFKYCVPNAIAPVIVNVTMGVASTVLSLSSLSYLGLGIRPPIPEWGALLNEAKAEILTRPYMIIFPGIFIALTVLSLNLLGDGLRDALDPKLKN